VLAGNRNTRDKHGERPPTTRWSLGEAEARLSEQTSLRRLATENVIGITELSAVAVLLGRVCGRP
jgi:hypothetical protein